MQQLRGDRPRRHGAGGEDPRDRQAREGRPHRAFGAHYALARRDVLRGRRDGARGLRLPAADRRGDHEPRAPRGQDQPELQPRAGDLRARCQPRGGRRLPCSPPPSATATSPRCRPSTARCARRISTTRRRRAGFRSPPRARTNTRSIGRAIRRCGRAFSACAIADYDLAELVPYIDWTPFFQAWELTGRYPQILDDNKVGTARKLFADARELLDPDRFGEMAAGVGRRRVLAGKQQWRHRAFHRRLARGEATRRAAHAAPADRARSSRDRAHTALADFVAPKEAGVPTTSAASR